MDNSMTEYKKKSKLAEMIDSLKYNAKILFAGKNQDKIKAAIMDRDEENRLESLDSQVDKLDNISGIIQSLPELDKMVALRRYINKDKINESEIEQIILGLSDPSKISALESYSDRLNGQATIEIINSVNKENKMKTITLSKDKLNSYDDIKSVMSGLDGKEKLEMFNIFGEQIKDNNALTDFVMTLDSKDRLNIPDEYKKAINLKQVIKSMDKEDMEVAFAENSPKMSIVDKKEIISLFDFDKKKEIVSKEVQQMNAGLDVKNMLTGVFDDREIQEVLPEYVDRLNSNLIKEVIVSYSSDLSKEELLLQNQNLLNKEHLMEGVKTLGDEGKFSILGKLDEEKLSPNEELRVIGSMENENVITASLERGEYAKGTDRGIAAKYISKLDERVLNQEDLLNQETIELLGEQEHYQLFKYIVIPGDGDNLDVSDALDNPSEFKAYLQLRDYYKNQELAVQNLANGIQEYSIHSELINDVMKSDTITYEQIAILEDLVKDKPYEEIKGMEDLEKYPQLRKERFEDKINENSIDATYELLLGVSEEKYKDIAQSFSNENSLSEELESIIGDLPQEEQGRVAETIAMLKVVDLVNEMPEEQRKEVLRSYNEELSKEFTEGSKVADARISMAGLKKDIRDIYGKELSNSIGIKQNEETRTEIIHEEGKDDIEVIHLEGEEFKVPVHVVNFADKGEIGNKHFEKREIGEAHICTFLISDKYLGKAPGESTMVAFANVGEEALIKEGSNDIGSTSMDRYGVERGSNSLNINSGSRYGFKKSDQLIEDTVKKDEPYNEVDMYREYMTKDGNIETLIPSHVVCFDKISEATKEEARSIAEKFGLDKPVPISVIHTEKYKDRIEEYAKEVRGENQVEIQQEVVEEKIEGKTISERVEEIMEIAEERADSRDIAKAQMEMINSQEQTQQVTQENQGYKKPTAMMSKDDSFEH